MKKILRFIFRDKVDLMLLLVVTAFLIKDFKSYSFCGIWILYIIGVMVRQGTSYDNLNKYVTDRAYREELKLYPVPDTYPRRKQTVFSIVVQTIFWLGFVAILGFFTLSG